MNKIYEFSATLPYSVRVTDEGNYLVVQVHAPEGTEAEQKRSNGLRAAYEIERIAREIRKEMRRGA